MTSECAGTLPSDQNATLLAKMDASNNRLSGAIDVGKLDYVYSVFLSNNFLSGSIPSGIGYMTSVEYLVLGHNSLSGSLPSELGQLSELKVLDLSMNYLEGSSSREFENWSELTVLTVKENRALDWNLTQISDWPNITDVLMQKCGILGTTPEWIPDTMESLLLENNKLSGTMSELLIDSANALELMDLSNNAISGTIPMRAASADAMQTLFLNNMQISGSLPAKDSRRTDSPLYDSLSTVFPSNTFRLD